MSGRVVVIGAGAVGLLTAHALRRRGFDVLVVERETAVGQGSSAGNMGWVCPSISLPVPSPAVRAAGLRWMIRPDSPLYISPTAALGMLPWLLSFWRSCSASAFEAGKRALIPLAADAPDRYRGLAAEGIDFEWHGDGLLLLFRTQAALDAERRLFESYDYRQVTEVPPEGISSLEPDLTAVARGFCGALHALPEGHVRPESVCRGVRARCEELGVEFRTGTAATGFRQTSASARAVRAQGGDGATELEADVFVIASGAETGLLSRDCGHALPMQAGKGYSITVREPAMSLRHPIYLAEDRVGVSPFEEGLRVAGTMELSGINQRLDRRRVASMRRAAERAVPGMLEGASRTEWVGMRPMTPDGLPVIGRLRSLDNVFVNSGHQMLGITLAPVSGEALAGMIAGDASVPEAFHTRAFDPARF